MIVAPQGQFSFPGLERILFGPGKIRDLGEELERRGKERAIVVTGRTLGRSRLLDQVTEGLGRRCVGVFDEAAPHQPSGTIRKLVERAGAAGADTLVSFGGGSAIDTAKVAAASLIHGRDMIADAGALDFSLAAAPTDRAPAILQVAVPTALSAGEFTPAGGVTDEDTGAKKGVIDPLIQPGIVVHDPALTVETPDWLWISTGIRALDHAVEAAYSIRRQPFTDTLAARAIRLLVRHLPSSIEAAEPESLAHRGYCQTAAWFSLYGGMNTGLGISHALGHQIGPAWSVPHGVTSCITLPHAMRFMARVAPQRFAPIAEGLDVPFDPAAPEQGALRCADAVAAFIAGFDVPTSLQAAGVDRDERHAVAAAVCEELTVFPVLDRSVTLGEIKNLLDAAYADT